MKKVTERKADYKKCAESWKRRKRGWRFSDIGDEARIRIAFQQGWHAAIAAERRASSKRKEQQP